MSVVSIESQLVRKAAVDWMLPRQMRALSCETTSEWRLLLRTAFQAGAGWTFKRARSMGVPSGELDRAARVWVASDMASYRGKDPLELTFRTWVRGYQYALSVIEDARAPFLPTGAGRRVR
jgi:hypothetical protein